MKELIDRNELLNIYNKWIDQLALPEDEGDRRGVTTCILVLEEAPIIDAVEVVHGKWENCSYFESDRRIYGDKCSVCKFEHYGPSINHYYYCPNCGAKMNSEVVNCADCRYTYDCICICCEENEMVYCSIRGKHMNANDTCIYGKQKG